MTQKTKPQVKSFADQVFSPRFEYGEMAQVNVLTGPEDATKLGTGFARFSNAEIPWTVRYDEVILVLEGSLTIKTCEGDLHAGAHDAIWLPNGTELTYVSESALVFYAIEPANWAET